MIAQRLLPVLLGLSQITQGLTPGRRGAIEGSIGEPTLYQSPRFRWWWPGGWIEPDEVTNEIQSIINAGFGGGEIGDVRDSITVPSDPKIYGWAQARWDKGLLAAYKEANKLGGHVDLTLGPHWPTGFPGYTPDSPETMKELVHGQVLVKAGKTYDGDLPLPEASPSGNSSFNNVEATAKLVAVLVAKTNATSASASVVGFEPKTVSVITRDVSNATTIKWTAPGDGNYILVAVYGRGTGQIQNMYDSNTSGPELTYPFPAYIVDHFSIAGVEAGVKYWSKHILSSELRGLLARSGGSIFEDSLELNLKQYWTLNFIKELKSRRGYDLTPFLLYVLKDTNTFSGDSQVAIQIQNDFYQTVSDLYVNYRLKPLQKWANSLGLKLRVQPYTASFDSSLIASIVDIPEGESLGFEGTPDSFRILATGRDIAGTTILSDELGAYMGKAYGVTWKFLLGTANHDMSLGVNQVVIHGFPYQTSQTSLWPGFAPFTPLGTSSNGFADAWGPRQPQWKFATEASSYLANSQKLLQETGASVDVAILNQDWGVTASWDDTSLNDAGYSYQFPTPELLIKNNVQVQGGKLAPKGPNYKALITNSSAIDPETAELLLSYGKSGLPIVIVGSLPDTTFSYFENAQSSLKKVTEAMTELKRLGTTVAVDDGSDVPKALSQLNVKPSVQYTSGSSVTLATLRRTKGSGYLYWIYNGDDSKFSGTMKLEGENQPFRIDLYSGKVSPVAAFSQSSGYTSVNLTIAADASVALYLGSSNPFGVSRLGEYLISTTCDSYVRDGLVYIASNISCTAKTNKGQIINLKPEEKLSSPQSSFNWTLPVQDWAPVDVNETGADSYKTIITTLSPVELSTLRPWSEIDSLKTASGIGTYTTAITINKNSTNTRVLFDVGNVEGTWGLKINNQTVSEVDWFGNQPLDISEYVKNGENDIEIVVATTLWSKLRKTWPAIYGSLDAQDIGLIGPVTVWYVTEKGVN